MPIKRLSLRDTNFSTSCDVSGPSKTVQDLSTTTKNMVMRLANGVVDASMLQNGCTFSDLGLPAHLDRFQAMDMLRQNEANIARIKADLEAQQQQQQTAPPKDPELTPPSNPAS